MRIAVLLFACAALAGAQETRGSIAGRVVDPSGAVVPAATVTATSHSTNVKLKAVTNPEGAYQILFVLPGVYSVTASISGFKTARQDNIEIPEDESPAQSRYTTVNGHLARYQLMVLYHAFPSKTLVSIRVLDTPDEGEGAESVDCPIWIYGVTVATQP